MEWDSDENEGAHVCMTNNRESLHFTDGLTEWLVTLGGFIRSIFFFFLFSIYRFPFPIINPRLAGPAVTS